MAEEIEEPERERELDPLRVLGFQGAEGPDEEAEARRVGVALGGEPGHGFEDPRPLGETLEVSARCVSMRRSSFTDSSFRCLRAHALHIPKIAYRL